MSITDDQWLQYERDGFLRLGPLLSPDELAELQGRINAIMLGTAQINYDQLLMQLDSKDGQYDNAGAQTTGFKGATLNYRKIQELEADPLFMKFMQRPLFREICSRIYGADTPIATFRAMFMNKPAHAGTLLPWHQDRWNFLDRDPLITIWAALDPATVANGCVQIIPGSHRLGLINPDHPSGFITEEQMRKFSPDDKIEYLELEAGEVALLHNWLLHRSDTNSTDTSRRAFSVCYMQGETQAENGQQFPRVFKGSTAL
jgi:phytanoyl-CoA hydroxylase